MKYYLLLFISLVFLNTVKAQTIIADKNAEPRSLNASFSSVSVSDGITVYLSGGDKESLAVSYSDEKYRDRFITVVENGILKISYDSRGINYNSNKKRKLVAYVSFTKLLKLDASGGADVIISGEADLTDISMKFTSGSVFRGKINAGNVDIVQTSGSIMHVSGKTEKLNIELNSGASFDGYDLSVDFCVAKASSGGAVRISVAKELEAKASSGGAIHYKGTGLIRDVHIKSGGMVKKV